MKQISENHSRDYLVQLVITDGYRLSEVAAVLEATSALKSTLPDISLDVRIVSPHGGTCHASIPAACIETDKTLVPSSAGLVVLAGGAGVSNHVHSLAHLYSLSRRYGHRILMLSEAVSALKKRGVFGRDVVCVAWDDPICDEPHWNDECAIARIFLRSDIFTTCCNGTLNYWTLTLRS